MGRCEVGIVPSRDFVHYGIQTCTKYDTVPNALHILTHLT